LLDTKKPTMARGQLPHAGTGYSAVISAYEGKSLWKPALGVLELLQLRSNGLCTDLELFLVDLGIG
jgi:hypothetical protein